MMFELKRGSMKEKWGLSIAFRFPDSASSQLPSFFCVLRREGPGGRVELGVSKVAMFSPAAKAGLVPGNTLLLIGTYMLILFL